MQRSIDVLLPFEYFGTFCSLLGLKKRCKLLTVKALFKLIFIVCVESLEHPYRVRRFRFLLLMLLQKSNVPLRMLVCVKIHCFKIGLPFQQKLIFSKCWLVRINHYLFVFDLINIILLRLAGNSTDGKRFSNCFVFCICWAIYT